MAKITGYTKREIEQIQIAVGLNLRAARRGAGLKQKHVMQELWGVTNTCNRISEIENGHKSLSLVDLLILQRLYGQSLDYICGLSVEPEVDMLAGAVNNTFNQSHILVEMLTGQIAAAVAESIKPICNSKSEALLASAKGLCNSIRSDHEKGINFSHDMQDSTRRLMAVIREVEVVQAKQALAVDSQMAQIISRSDKKDRHVMIKDVDKQYQYSLPLPPPHSLDESIAVGVGYDD